MFDEGAKGIEREGLEDGGLADHISHWVEVLDRWVKELDKGMGRNGADGASEPGVADIDADS
jgi:hypothetical protein